LLSVVLSHDALFLILKDRSVSCSSKDLVFQFALGRPTALE